MPAQTTWSAPELVRGSLSWALVVGGKHGIATSISFCILILSFGHTQVNSINDDGTDSGVILPLVCDDPGFACGINLLLP